MKQNTAQSLETEARKAIAALYALKLNREASQLGSVLGSWLCNVGGDSLLRGSIAMAYGVISRNTPFKS